MITIQFSVNTVSMLKTVLFQIIQFSISTQFKCKYDLIVKKFFQAIQFSQKIKFSICMPLVPFYPPIGPHQVWSALSDPLL